MTTMESVKQTTEDFLKSENQSDIPQQETRIEEEEDTNEETESAKDLKIEEEWVDILGSGVIMKKLLHKGAEDIKPNRADKCLVNISSYVDLQDPPIETLQNLQIDLGEGDVVQGLDVSIGLMEKGEKCLLKIGSRLAYGVKGLPPHIPPNETITFEVELLDILPPEDWDSLGILERQKLGNKKRERGNWWYQRGENTLAIQCYRRALDYLDEVETDVVDKPTDSQLQSLLEDRLKVLNNMASAQIKMELYEQALKSLQTVLRCQPDNVKAQFRKAKIHVARNELPIALKLLEKAKLLEPEDGLIAKELNLVNFQMNKQKNSEREYARRMFGGSGIDKSKQADDSQSRKKEGNKIGLIATVGLTALVGAAGVAAYKFKLW